MDQQLSVRLVSVSVTAFLCGGLGVFRKVAENPALIGRMNRIISYAVGLVAGVAAACTQLPEYARPRLVQRDEVQLAPRRPSVQAEAEISRDLRTGADSSTCGSSQRTLCHPNTADRRFKLQHLTGGFVRPELFFRQN
jgi:hypothetical protein